MAASILIGITPLLAAMAAAGYLTRRRPRGASDLPNHFAQLFIVAVAWQSLHFIEELATGFYTRYSQVLGLEPWPLIFFVLFNLAWIAVWLLSVPLIERGFLQFCALIWREMPRSRQRLTFTTHC